MKISIVTPSFNQGPYIERTIRSVLLQAYPDLEYIVMDGGSTDNTLTVLDKYRHRFAHCQSAPDEGQADAIARGFERSTGEIMAYLNSDDLLAPGTLHFVDQFFSEHPKVDAIYSHRLAIDENDRVVWYWLLPTHLSYLHERWDYIPQETCFWRRRLFDRGGNINPSYAFAMDFDLFVRYMKIGKFVRVDRFLAAFREHSASKTSTMKQTTGRAEFERLWERNQIKRHVPDPLIESWFEELPSKQGLRFAFLRRHLPGGFTGVGYDYNDFWGGHLRAVEESVGNNKITQAAHLRRDLTAD